MSKEKTMATSWVFSTTIVLLHPTEEDPKGRERERMGDGQRQTTDLLVTPAALTKRRVQSSHHVCEGPRGGRSQRGDDRRSSKNAPTASPFTFQDLSIQANTLSTQIEQHSSCVFRFLP